MLAKEYGVLDWIMNPRIGYQLHRTGNGMFYALAKLCLSTFIGLYFLYASSNKQLIYRFLIVIPIAYMLGSKGYLLDILIFLFIVLWFRKFKYQKVLYTTFLPLIFLLMIYLLKPDDIEGVVAYFDYYLNSARFYEAMSLGQLDYFYGKIYLTDFWGLVPRSIFPEKPVIYGFLYVNEFFFPGAAEATNTPAFGGPVAPYADFGIIGVILSSLFNFKTLFLLYSYNLIFKKTRYEEIIIHPLTVFLILLYFSPQYLDFFNFPLNIVMYLIVLSILCWSSRLKLAYKTN